MGEWTRTTREIAARELPPEVVAALQAHTERFGITIPLEECVMCIETDSKRIKRGIFRRGPFKHVHHVIITPEWLAITMRTDGEETTALTVRLREATAEDFHDSPIYRVQPDNGVHVNGLFTGQVGMHGNATITLFLPLGEELVAERFKTTLSAKIAAAKP